MTQGLDEFIELTRTARNSAELETLFKCAIEQEGYENFGFATARNNRVERIIWMEFPKGYVAEYRDRQWDSIDPVLHYASNTLRPFCWVGMLEKTKLSREQSVFLRECRELGVHSGVTIPLHALGNRIDFFSLSLRHEREAPMQRISFLYALTVQAWLRQHELTDEFDASTLEPALLTPREIECLKWTKDGKTNWEIGLILSISERTVEFHLSNTMKKLGASSRIMAVIVAIQKGLLPL
jgi:DNA-binding CsgD family transcriptional regulator